jgi:hypothetical protein
LHIEEDLKGSIICLSELFSKQMLAHIEKHQKYLKDIPNYSKKDATFFDLFIFTKALHVSGGSSAHHQEHITVHTASGIVSQYCC